MCESRAATRDDTSAAELPSPVFLGSTIAMMKPAWLADWLWR
jgi:hypothetical protein